MNDYLSACSAGEKHVNRLPKFATNIPTSPLCTIQYLRRLVKPQAEHWQNEREATGRAGSMESEAVGVFHVFCFDFTYTIPS